VTIALNHLSPVPLYHQLKELLRGEIDARKWDEGSFPTEQELCKQFGISRATVRQALAGLVQEGLVVRRPGRGTMVLMRKIQRNTSHFLSFTQDLEDQGLVPSVRVLHTQTIRAQPGLAQQLGIAESAPVLVVTRVRYANAEPLVLESRYFPLDWFPGIENQDFTRKRFSEIVSQHFGFVTASEDRYVEPGLADSFEAKTLEITPGSPVLRMERIFRVKQSKAISMSIWAVRGDRCRYHIRIAAPELGLLPISDHT